MKLHKLDLLDCSINEKKSPPIWIDLEHVYAITELAELPRHKDEFLGYTFTIHFIFGAPSLECRMTSWKQTIDRGENKYAFTLEPRPPEEMETFVARYHELFDSWASADRTR